MIVSRTGFFLFLTLLVLTTSCEVFDREEPIPSWIEVDVFEIRDNPSIAEGDLSEDIRDVWLTIDGERIGTFELPARIPVLDAGPHEIVVAPGIFVSGQTDLRDRYLFYKSDTFDIDLKAGETYKLEPETRYLNSSLQEILVIEDFEDGDDRMSTTGSTNAAFERVSDPNIVAYGDGCGVMYLNETVTNAVMRTNGTIGLPNSDAVFFELDIASDYYVQYGVYVNSLTSDQAIDVYLMKPTGSDNWKKQYVGLGSTIQTAYGFYSPESFYIYAQAMYNADSLPKVGTVKIDNVKMLYVK